MAVPLLKAKEVCTSSEFALVSASRRPKLNKLSPEQVRFKAGRARKALDKWQDLSRAEARAGSAKGRTRLKAQLFRDVLDRFEAKAAAGTAKGSATGGKQARQTKQARAIGHRKARSAVREKLAGATASWDRREKATGTGAVRGPAAAGKTKGRPGAPARSAKKHRPPLKWADVLGGAKFPGSPDWQGAARARGKQIRAEASGATSPRVRAHVKASGKRAQARRDRKGSDAGW
jgi:hypothetical protein